VEIISRVLLLSIRLLIFLLESFPDGSFTNPIDFFTISYQEFQHPNTRIPGG